MDAAGLGLPRPTKRTGVLTLRLRECSAVLFAFPDTGKKLPVRKATNCSLQSAVASGGNKVAGRVTEARATEFWREKSHPLNQMSIYSCPLITKGKRNYLQRKIVERGVMRASAAAKMKLLFMR